MNSNEGPFCYGEYEIGFVDMLVAPFMIRNFTHENYRDYHVTDHLEPNDRKKYEKWVEAVMNDKNVQTTLQDPERLNSVSISRFIEIF